MSERIEKKLRQLARRKFKYDYNKMLEEIKKEALMIRIRWLFGLIKRLFFSKTAKLEKNSI